MDLNGRVTIMLTSRMFPGEIGALQKKIGCVLPLKDCHGTQNIQSLGLAAVYSRETAPDFVAMYHYLSDCNLAILDEVNPDSLILTLISPNLSYGIKNAYNPTFFWPNNSVLCVIPPLFGRDNATVTVESNSADIVFPMLLPKDVANDVLQRLLLHTVYSRLGDLNMVEFGPALRTISFMGKFYEIELGTVSGPMGLSLLDNLALYLCILTSVIPVGCARFITGLNRQNQHELMTIFQGMVPPEIVQIGQRPLDVFSDIERMKVLISYLQSLSSLFNLGKKLVISSYSPETASATCWLQL